MSSQRATARGTSAPMPSSRTDEVRLAAAALFERRGYAATTMTHIADASGVLPGSLYHHFGSKEEIAVEILKRFDRELGSVSARLAASAAGLAPEDRFRHLMREVAVLSFRHGGAVALRYFEPPTVATARLREAQQVRAPVLERMWKTAVDDVTGSGTGAENARLLRFALKNLSLDAAAYFPGHPDPAAVADDVSELLLHGIVADCPSDDELDRSEALEAVDDALSTWPSRPEKPVDGDVRTRIIAAARTEFARHGYAATTIRDIAERAGVRMATLYRRVESKEAMLADVVDAFSTSLDKAFRAALTTGEPGAASLDALAKTFVKARRRFREESDILQIEHATDSDLAPLSRYARQTQDRLRLLESVLQRGMAKGTLRSFAAPQDIADPIRSVLWLAYQDSGRTSEARTHAFLRRTMLRGYMTPDS
ncbi:TetR family transcriptional regulator [Actinomadura sp. LD22]|uniref:TetR family transcriptional regulator n=1 Tax=Actinomadura physcomitrii TaxID=2650748 RepID=A0A6I4M2X0_9ACTN|nr:TetR/AcrR family transcriptional regulator [Actinomadura physcomitrii]MVZ99781.1 TetR family transcriptional regulator [Actinomadura physcomitrii]